MMGLLIEPTAIPDVKIVTPQRFGDMRGSFVETYNRQDFARVSTATFVQDNQSMSPQVGTIRGLHYQLAPHTQCKLVRVVRGAILDVAVDLRKSAASFGRHVAVELSADNGRQLWVPEGFAHGFVTRAPDTEIIYKTTGYYHKPSERGLLWDDQALGIDWGVASELAVLRDQDRHWPKLSDLTEVFA